MTSIACGACDTVVYSDALVFADHDIEHLWWSDSRRWTHETFGVVHECDPADRARVYARDGLPVCNSPWRQFAIRWWCRLTGPRYPNGKPQPQYATCIVLEGGGFVVTP